MRYAPLLAVLALPGLLAFAVDKPKPPTWLDDLAEARTQARKTGKPLFVVLRCER